MRWDTLEDERQSGNIQLRELFSTSHVLSHFSCTIGILYKKMENF